MFSYAALTLRKLQTNLRKGTYSRQHSKAKLLSDGNGSEKNLHRQFSRTLSTISEGAKISLQKQKANAQR